MTDTAKTKASTAKPRAAKTPQDHKPPRGKVRHVQVMGVDVDIDPSRLDDWELMETLYDLQADPEGNALKVVPFIRTLLGETQYQTVKEQLRDSDGRITGSRMSEFMTGLFEHMDPNS